MRLNLFKLDEIKQINIPSGGRIYLTPEGKSYPSVTTVTGIINAKAIALWRKRIGEKEADAISKKASTKGTRFHELMEKTILNEGVFSTQCVEFNEFSQVHKQILQEVFPFIEEINCVETKLYGDEIQCAGTVDLVGTFHGKHCVMDWKTSSHRKSAKDVINYWLQTAAYALMLKEKFNYDVEKLVLFFNVSEEYFYMMSEDASPWMKKFKELREVYRKIKGV